MPFSQRGPAQANRVCSAGALRTATSMDGLQGIAGLGFQLHVLHVARRRSLFKSKKSFAILVCFPVASEDRSEVFGPSAFRRLDATT